MEYKRSEFFACPHCGTSMQEPVEIESFDAVKVDERHARPAATIRGDPFLSATPGIALRCVAQPLGG